jgi:hypothetical protein
VIRSNQGYLLNFFYFMIKLLIGIFKNNSAVICFFNREFYRKQFFLSWPKVEGRQLKSCIILGEFRSEKCIVMKLHSMSIHVFDAIKVFRSPLVTVWTERYGQKNQTISVLHNYVPNQNQVKINTIYLNIINPVDKFKFKYLLSPLLLSRRYKIYIVV